MRSIFWEKIYSNEHLRIINRLFHATMLQAKTCLGRKYSHKVHIVFPCLVLLWDMYPGIQQMCQENCTFWGGDAQPRNRTAHGRDLGREWELWHGKRTHREKRGDDTEHGELQSGNVSWAGVPPSLCRALASFASLVLSRWGGVQCPAVNKGAIRNAKVQSLLFF